MKNQRHSRDRRDARDAGKNESGFIPPHGGYEGLHSYRKALILYDATVYFCARFLDRRDRTYDQMVQAARSGKQNIVEGSEVSGTSKEFEIKLTSVARGSLAELREDYGDFLRKHRLARWDKGHRYMRRLQQLNRSTPEPSYATFKRGIEHADPAICANVIMCLIELTCYLLDRQIAELERDFLREGGLRERMARARMEERARQRREGPEET